MDFSEEVAGVLHRAVLAANDAGQAVAMPEHIALELIVEDEAAMFLARCGTDLVAVESRLREHLESAGSEDEQDDPDGRGDAQPGAAFHHVIESAMQRAEDEGRDCLMLRDLFLALLDDEDRESMVRIAIVEATRDPQALEELHSFPRDDE